MMLIFKLYEFLENYIFKYTFLVAKLTKTIKKLRFIKIALNHLHSLMVNFNIKVKPLRS